MCFPVAMARKVQPTPAIMALIPAETARGLELDAQDVREHLFLAADNSRGWQVFQADSRDGVESVVQSFSFAPYSTITITALAEQPTE